jgi:hypothetical protein
MLVRVALTDGLGLLIEQYIGFYIAQPGKHNMPPRLIISRNTGRWYLAKSACSLSVNRLFSHNFWDIFGNQVARLIP